MNSKDVLNELAWMRRDIRELRALTMSDARNQWITHAKLVLNDCLVHLPDMELRNQVNALLEDEQI